MAKINKAALVAYGVGSSRGHALADQWTANPQRGNSYYGGTLQHVILDLAKRFKEATTEEEVALIRGEIVGFSYRIECPADALRCAAADKARDMKAAA